MYGPSLTATSGISSVVNNWIAAGYREKVELRYISTLTEFVPGKYIQKIQDALRAYFCTILLRKKTTDIIHIHVSSGMSFYRKLVIFVLVKIKGFPVVTHLHSGSFENFYYEGSRLRRALITYFFNRADLNIVLSNSWKLFMESIADNGRVRILYNGASSKMFSGDRKNHKGRIVISFMGRLGRGKGVYDLLDAFEALASEVPEAKLIMGGDGEVLEVRRLVSDKNLSGRIEVPGWVQGKDKIAVFTKSDIYVLPSYCEGLPGSIMEAMAAGLPIISTPVGGIPEVVIDGQNGFLVNCGDIGGLHEMMLLLCNDSALRKRMGNESLKMIETRFDTLHLVEKLVKYYSEIPSVSMETRVAGSE